MTPLPLAPVGTQRKPLRGRLHRPCVPLATRSPGLEDGKPSAAAGALPPPRSAAPCLTMPNSRPCVPSAAPRHAPFARRSRRTWAMKPTDQKPGSATACAGRATRNAAARPPSAPLPRVRFAVGGPHEGVVKRAAEPASDGSPAGRKQEHRAMSGHDAELALFRGGVNCAALLESLVPGWKLDPKESTRRALKYRRGDGAILIVNHDGRGWWDPKGTAKGDVFDLVQHLDPCLNFGQVRQVLRCFVGVTPSFPMAVRAKKGRDPDRPLPERWRGRPRLHRGSPAWRYLTETRSLPDAVLHAAADQDAVRDGYRGSAWFAHRARDAVTHIEVRGPSFKGSLTGGRKTLFRFSREGQGCRRLVITEAPIDALSIAAIEGESFGTVYVATGGGMGPGTIAAIEAMLTTIAITPNAVLLSATDANAAGERYAVCHA